MQRCCVDTSEAAKHCVATSEKSISGATVNSEQVGLDTHVTTTSSLTFDVAEAKNRPVSKVSKVIKQLSGRQVATKRKNSVFAS